MRILTRWLVVALWVVAATPAFAQTWSAEQQDVWRVEEQLWQRDNARDIGWIDTHVHPSAVGWNFNDHVPRNRASIVRWDKYEYANSQVLEFELFPLSIVITGNTAVVHYRYRSAVETSKKEREMSTGRYTDVFVREGGRWLIVTMVGGDDPKR